MNQRCVREGRANSLTVTHLAAEERKDSCENSWKMSWKQSSIWVHFINVDNVRAQCRICQHKISYKAGSTYNLHRQMRPVHPTVKLAVVERRETSGPASDSGGASVSTQSSRPTPRPTATQSSMDQFIPKSMSEAKQGQIDIALAKMIDTD